MKKRIAIMMFAGCVCLSVVGCGGKKETETTAATVETVAETQETDTVATEATEETVIAEESTEAESVEETQESETPEETAQADVSDDGVSSDFKEMMDSYEAFFDEYIDFMKAYKDSDDVLGMAADYACLLYTSPSPRDP